MQNRIQIKWFYSSKQSILCITHIYHGISGNVELYRILTVSKWKSNTTQQPAAAAAATTIIATNGSNQNTGDVCSYAIENWISYCA